MFLQRAHVHVSSHLLQLLGEHTFEFERGSIPDRVDLLLQAPKQWMTQFFQHVLQVVASLSACFKLRLFAYQEVGRSLFGCRHAALVTAVGVTLENYRSLARYPIDMLLSGLIRKEVRGPTFIVASSRPRCFSLSTLTERRSAREFLDSWALCPRNVFAISVFFSVCAD